MAEFKEGQGVKTHRDNDFSGKIVDGQSGAAATDVLSVVGEGDTVTANTNDWGIPAMFKKEDGTYCIPATDDNCAVKVVVVDEGDDTRNHSYKVHTGVTASGGTDDHDTVIPNAETIQEAEVILSSPGCFKYEVGTFDGVSTFTVYATLITQPATSTVCCKVCLPSVTGDGTLALRVRATNNDDTDNDAFSTVCFISKSA